ECQPENWRRGADQRDGTDRAINEPFAFRRGEDTEWNSKQHAEGHRRYRELDGRRKVLPEILDDGAMRLDGYAEIAAHNVRQVVKVLLVERPVEAPFLPEGTDDLRIALRGLAQTSRHRIRWNEVRDDKRGERHPDGQGDNQKHPARDVGLDRHDEA